MSDRGRPGEIRRVIANIVLTLDGRTTGPAGEFDMSYIAPHGISNQMRDALVEMTYATTVLLGRKNYEGFGAYWPTIAHAADAGARDQRFARWLDEAAGSLPRCTGTRRSSSSNTATSSSRAPSASR